MGLEAVRELSVRVIYRFILPPLIWLLYWSLSKTWRVSIEEPPALKAQLQQRRPVVFAHFHGDELSFLSLIRRYRIATIISTSVDGDLMTRVVSFAGGVSSRGSSTRGGTSALRGLLRLVKNQSRNCSFAVDGPKGPLHKVKPGVFELSRLMNAEIFAGGVACSSAWVFPKSWNKTYLPKPFCRLHFHWNGPFQSVDQAQDPRDPLLAEALEGALHQAQLIAQKKLL